MRCCNIPALGAVTIVSIGKAHDPNAFYTLGIDTQGEGLDKESQAIMLVLLEV